MKQAIFVLLAIWMIATDAQAQFFTAIVNPANAADITNDTVIVTADAYANGQFNYYVKFKQHGTGNWTHTDTSNGNGNGTIAKLIGGLSGSTQYDYEFTMYDTLTGQSFTSTDGLTFTTTSNPQPTVVDPDWLIAPTATSATFVPRVHAIGGPVRVYAEYNTKYGSGYPYKTDSVEVTGASQYPILHAYGLTPDDTFKVRIRTVPLYNSGGLVQPTASSQKEFATLPLTTAEATSIAQSGQWQDSVKVTGIVTIGSSGQAYYKFDLLAMNGGVVHNGNFVSTNTNGAFSKTFPLIDMPDSQFVARFIVKDGANFDTTAVTVITDSVPLPTGATLPVVINKHDGELVISVNPGGTWTASTTLVSVQWGMATVTGYAHSASYIVTSDTSFLVTLGWFAHSTSVKYKVTATNAAGSVLIAQSVFTTSGPSAATLLSTGQMSASAGTANFIDWGYAVAADDTTRIVLQKVTDLSATSVIDSVVLSGLFTGSGTYDASMNGLEPNGVTSYFRAKGVNKDGIVSYSSVMQISSQPSEVPQFLVVVDTSADAYEVTMQILGDGGGYDNDLSIEVKNSGVNYYNLSGAPIGNGTIDESYHIAPLSPATTYHYKVCFDNSFYGLFCKEGDFRTKDVATGFEEIDEDEKKELSPGTKCDAYNLSGQLIGRCTVLEAKTQRANLAAQWNTTGMIIMMPVEDENGQTIPHKDAQTFKVVLTK